MKIYVCVKQVPDTSGKVAVNPDGTLNRASMQTITNPDDMNAVEAALKLKDATGCKVTVVTMGPPPAAGMLRELMAMGADEGVLVSAREFGGSDTYATSQILAAALSTLGVEKDDIVMCGRQVLPTYLSVSLFCLEGNVRYASILGYVGAGGLGLIMNEKIGWREYDSLGMILIVLFITVLIIEGISHALRKRLT